MSPRHGFSGGSNGDDGGPAVISGATFGRILLLLPVGGGGTPGANSGEGQRGRLVPCLSDVGYVDGVRIAVVHGQMVHCNSFCRSSGIGDIFFILFLCTGASGFCVLLLVACGLLVNGNSVSVILSSWLMMVVPGRCFPLCGGIIFSRFSLGVRRSFDVDESGETYLGCDFGDLVGGCTGAFGRLSPHPLVVATASARMGPCIRYRFCGKWRLDLCAFSSDGRRRRIQGPRSTGMIPGRRATEEKILSAMGCSIGSQSCWSAMVFPRSQGRSGWRLRRRRIDEIEDGQNKDFTGLSSSFSPEVLFVFVPELLFLLYPSELYSYVYLVVLA